MLTLRQAATLLSSTEPGALAAITNACGFEGPLLPLPATDRTWLRLDALPDAVAPSVSIGRGPESLRALVVRVSSGAADGSLREIVARLATQLARRAPQLTWLCIASRESDRAPANTSGGARSTYLAPTRERIVATWSADRSPPRVVALVVDADAIVDSDAETLAAMAAAATTDAALVHARWLDILGRESLTRRFYRVLARAVDGLADSVTVPAGDRRPTADAARAVALLYASRLLFLAFLEAKGWLNGDRDFLARQFAECAGGPGDFHRRVLRPLFFGTLNTPRAQRAPAAVRFGDIPFLNGGLFGPTPIERRLRGASFSDEALGVLIGHVLGHYRFTAREDRRSWSEVAIDPEMLGKSFEALMVPHVRHATGAYYTPQALVATITNDALVHTLCSSRASPAQVAAILNGDSADSTAVDAVRQTLARIRVIDPACGSGAFLVHALDVLADLAGKTGDGRSVSERRRSVLTRSIFGVDINPMAVWLCELRLWLAVIIDTPTANPGAVTPLPNLDRNVRVGDALAGGGLAAGDGTDPWMSCGRTAHLIARARDRYTRARGSQKHDALRVLDRLERQRAIEVVRRELARITGARLDAVTLARGRDLFGAPASRRATASSNRAELRTRARLLRRRLDALRGGGALSFSFSAHFADAADDGGFDLVMGNPPWVRPHAVPLIDRERQRREFAASRAAAWTRKAGAGRGAGGFGHQIDLSALFVERALSIARPGGVVALLVPAKLWSCLAGGGLRQLITEQATLVGIEDWSTAPAAFDAAAYPSLVVMRRTSEATKASEVAEAAGR